MNIELKSLLLSPFAGDSAERVLRVEVTPDAPETPPPRPPASPETAAPEPSANRANPPPPPSDSAVRIPLPDTAAAAHETAPWNTVTELLRELNSTAGRAADAAENQARFRESAAERLLFT